MRERALEQRGAAWVSADGSRRAEMPVTAFDGNGMVSKLEILRGDLVDVLYQATKDSTEYRFSTRISALKQDDDAVEVTLANGTQLRADLVVGADGPHSAVRRLAFGPEEQFVKPIGGYNAWFSAPDHVGLDGWFLMYRAPGGLNASMRPSHDPAIAKAGLAFRSEPISYDRHDLGEQREILTERFAGAEWDCLDGLALVVINRPGLQIVFEHLTIVFAALAISHWIEHQTGWSIKKFVRTARRYRTVQIRSGRQTLTAADPLPEDLAKIASHSAH